MNRRDKLVRLMHTIVSGSYPMERLEIIIVDNCSSDDSVATVKAKFPSVRVLQQEVNRFSAGGRSIGAAAAAGEIVFFIDDDNILDRDCVRHLVRALHDAPKLGVAAPLMMCYPKRDNIWCAGGRLNRFGNSIQLNQLPPRQDEKVSDIIDGMDYFPNAFAVRRSLFMSGLCFDTVLFPHNWSEQDFGQQVKRLGFELATVRNAVTWHDSAYGYRSRITRTSPDLTFDQARSRIVFRRKYFDSFRLWLYFWLWFFPISSGYYLWYFTRQSEFPVRTLVWAYVRGSVAGCRQRI
jgi:hypothetical protein